MTQPKFSMVHSTDLYEEEIIDGFAIYAFLSYSDCEESARQQNCLDDTEEEESVNGDKSAPKSVVKSTSSGSNYIRNFNTRQIRSRSGSRSSTGDASNGSIYLENGKNILFHRSVARRKAGRPKGSYSRRKVQIKHELFEGCSDPSVDAQELNRLYDHYFEERIKEEEENEYKFTLPQSMDTNFVTSSLNALDASLKKEKTFPKTEQIEPELTNEDVKDISEDHDQTNNSSNESPDAPENDANLTEMISRHSKREIRLPARYYQSGLLMGSQWVIPEYESEDKIPKKKIKIEEPEEDKLSQPPNQTQVRSQPSSQPQSPPNLIEKKEQLQPLKPQPLSQPQLQQQQLPRLLPKPQSQSQDHHQLQSSPRPQFSTSQNHHQSTPIQPQKAPHPSPKPQQSHLKPLFSWENRRIIFYNNSATSNLDRTKEDDKSLSSNLSIESSGSITKGDDTTNLISPIKTCPVSQLELHQEKLERLQLLRKQQEICNKLRENNVISNISKDHTFEESITPGNLSIQSDSTNLNSSSSISSCGSPDQLNQNNLKLSSVNANQSSSNSPIPPMDNSDLQDQKNAKLQELRQLYRDLYFENRPERRLIYAKNRIKPRVNKKSEVEEAIRVIETLNKRDKQLDYIKKLLNMWNKKLNLAAKVITDTEVTLKGVDVVRDVLKTYQASKSYRVTEAWDTLIKPKTSPSLTAINSCSQPYPVRQIETTRRPGSSVIKTIGSSSSLRIGSIVVNPQSKFNSTLENNNRTSTPVTLPVVATETTTSTPVRIIDHSVSTERSNGVSLLSKVSNSMPRIKVVPLNQSQFFTLWIPCLSEKQVIE